jgi:uncharacterized cupin superfamily protein
MLRSLRRFFVAAVALALIGVPFASPAYADEADSSGDVTWMVRPSDGVGEDGRSWIEVELDPGARVEEHLLVRNLSTQAITFQLSAADGYFTKTGRFNMLTADQESTDAGTWIDIQDTVEVPSGGDAIVPFTITVPDNATPGDHPAGVAAGIRSGGDDQVGFESRIGFRVMTRVTGELAPAVTVDAGGGYVSTWNPFEAGQLDVGYTVTNAGNTRLSVTPEVTASALFGLVSFTATGEEIREMAPGESRTAEVSFPSVWPLFTFSADVKANASAVSDDLESGEVEPASTSTIIVAIPWPQLITIAIAVLFLWLLRRDHRRREEKMHERLEQARQQGREEAATPEVRRGAAVGFSALALTAAFALGGAAPAFAAADPEPEQDPSGVSIQVDIVSTPAPTPTPSPTGSPTPSPAPGGGGGSGGSGDLPATGAPDLSGALFGGAAAVGAGILMLLGHRRWTEWRAKGAATGE